MTAETLAAIRPLLPPDSVCAAPGPGGATLVVDTVADPDRALLALTRALLQLTRDLPPEDRRSVRAWAAWRVLTPDPVGPGGRVFRARPAP